MSIFTEKSVEVEIVDNGYVLTWKDETRRANQQEWSRRLGAEPKTRGREVIETKSALLKRLKELL